MKKIMLLVMLTALVTGISAQANGDREEERPVIQLALLLDTSNSMDGLINQAKSQLWKIVSQTARERRLGRQPILQVALYEYGNSELSILSGYVRQVVPFTTDLDYLSQKLFELRTNGGDEYCGKVIMSANRQLDWSDNEDSLKLIFIAGNESFDQGGTSFYRAGEQSVENDIVVNTIFCGSYYDGKNTYWEEGAIITGGTYMNINSDHEDIYRPAPQDDRIEDLNLRLNSTYLGYGQMGIEKKETQMEQDSNAMSLNKSSFLDRAQVKSSSSYSNSEWDLVDAMEEEFISLEDLEPEALPPELQGLTHEEQEDYIQDKAAEREEIQKEIAQLSAEREQYLQELVVEESDESTLDKAMVNAIRSAAENKGFELE